MLDDLTNWYIRLNRRRLKGEFGTESSVIGLNTLFEVLFFLARSLAPFTPFVADHIYLLLKPYLPDSILGPFDDDRSVHFLPYPTFKEEFLDPEVERKFDRMKSVIALARTSRERRSLGLKTLLKSLAVVHPDPTYLSDLKSLESYIRDELNVESLELTSDESRYGVKYSCTANWPVLGQKWRKDIPKVKRLLSELTTDQVKAFLNDKAINIGGVCLTEEDLVVKREVPVTENQEAETNSDNDVLTVLDVKQYPGLYENGLAREIVNRVQRLRKKAGLVATDDVEMAYHVTEDPPEVGVSKVFQSHAGLFESTLRRPLVAQDVLDSRSGEAKQRVILEEDQDIHGAKFLLKLLRIQ
jgi:isoleucyl-tRNA synthetase